MSEKNFILGYNFEVNKLNLNLKVFQLLNDSSIRFLNVKFLITSTSKKGSKTFFSHRIYDSNFKNNIPVVFMKDDIGYDIIPQNGLGLIGFTGFGGGKDAVTIYDNKGISIKELPLIENSFAISIIDNFIFCVGRDSNSLPYCISKLDYFGNLIWTYPHNFLLQLFPFNSPIRFDDENFLFYDITEVGEHNVYNKAWLVVISSITGVLKWKKEIEGLLAIDFLYCKDKVIVRTKTTIQCYQVDNGALVWEYEIDLEERQAFLKKWSEKVSGHWLSDNGTYKFNFTIGQNDILHVLTFQKYVQIDVHTGKILNDFDYATQVAKFKFRFNASPIGNIVKVTTTHVIASVKHMAVFINMKTGLIDHYIEGEDKNGGTIMDIIIPSDNVLVLSETCATKRFPNTIVKVYESK
jgi:hypothetical protein